MNEDTKIEVLVAMAVQEAVNVWAIQHPHVAAVIKRIDLYEKTAERLRDSQAFKEAVRAFREANSELQFAEDLLKIVTPIVLALLV